MEGPHCVSLPGTLDIGGKFVCQATRTVSGAHQSAQRANHVEDFGDGALVERVYRDAFADKRRDDVGLKIGKGENQIRVQCQDFRNIRQK